jgi:hypothetical protein
MPNNIYDTAGTRRSPRPVATSDIRGLASRVRLHHKRDNVLASREHRQPGACPVVGRSADALRLSTNDDVVSGFVAGESQAEVGMGALDALRAEQGLRSYVHRVAEGLGVGLEGVWSELADEAAAYVALDEQLPSRPGRNVALVWDDRRGWAVAVETRSGEDLLMVAWYGPELLPAPQDVVRFTQDVLAGRASESAPPAVRTAARKRVRVRLARRPASDRAQ